MDIRQGEAMSTFSSENKGWNLSKQNQSDYIRYSKWEKRQNYHNYLQWKYYADVDRKYGS